MKVDLNVYVEGSFNNTTDYKFVTFNIYSDGSLNKSRLR